MPRPVKNNQRYISGLDGLRALSVLGVIFYHLHFKWIDGGFLGVTVFFVLSGYLITDILVREYSKTGKINFKNFWIKRFRRLLPSLFIMLILVSAWITLFQRSFLGGLRGEILAAFTYVSNWYYVFQDHSYFTKFAPPSPMQHMWSLAVEEQYYIIWPIIMLLLLKFIPSKAKIAGLILLLSFVSAEAMAYFFTPGVDPSRIYYGTDTRAFSLLIGASLALVWPSAKLSANVTPDLKRILNIAGAVSLVALLAMMVFIQEDGTFLYYGGMYLASIVTAILIAVIVHPASSIGKIFSVKPLLWIGVRSYGIYLWHFPIIVLLGMGVSTGDMNVTKVIIALVLTFVISGLSWKYIEDPIRRGEWRNWISAIRNRQVSWRWKQQSIMQRTVSIVVSVILITFVVGMIYQPSSGASSSKELENHLEKEKEKNDKQKALEKKQSAAEKKKAEAEALKKAKAEAKKAAEAEKKAANDKAKREKATFEKNAADAKVALAKTPATALGDSVLLSATSALQEYIPNMDIHATKGLQVQDALGQLRTLISQGRVQNIVLIDLGTNGFFKETQWAEMYALLGKKRQIYLMNVRVDRSWQDGVNKTISKAVAENSNVHLIDWYKETANRPEIFYNDKIHPNIVGGKFYASLVAIEIAKNK